MSQNVPPQKKSLLAMALASGISITDAAEQAGVCRKTVQRYLAKPAFRRLVARYRNELISTALGRMADGMTRAADAIAGLLDEKDPAIRLRAARAMVTLGQRLRDSVDVTDRIHEIERELARKKGLQP
jgi:hypothetical protein